ncbi:hypothetical protein [Burkholderia mayonis]|uniref:hypothetical protein n=1 Tax=Burkholderia mayonis TaxID=1385591 RepID=UPI00193A95FA|nr:hypothetical protein [Burkholderia mayonis]
MTGDGGDDAEAIAFAMASFEIVVTSRQPRGRAEVLVDRERVNAVIEAQSPRGVAAAVRPAQFDDGCDRRAVRRVDELPHGQFERRSPDMQALGARHGCAVERQHDGRRRAARTARGLAGVDVVDVKNPRRRQRRNLARHADAGCVDVARQQLDPLAPLRGAGHVRTHADERIGECRHARHERGGRRIEVAHDLASFSVGNDQHGPPAGDANDQSETRMLMRLW